MKTYKTHVSLTIAELDAILGCLGNGYGNGDFDDWLNNKTASANLRRGWDKLERSARELHEKRSAATKRKSIADERLNKARLEYQKMRESATAEMYAEPEARVISSSEQT